MDEISDPKELIALDAIIAASLAGRKCEDVSDEELLRRFESAPELAGEASGILHGIGEAPFSKMLRKPAASCQVADEPAGMYRAGSDDTLSAELKAEIDEKRRAILKRLHASRDK